MQIDSTNTTISNLINSWTAPSVLVGICGLFLTLFFNHRNKKKIRPTMTNIEGIYDEYGSRLFFTIISNNPAGSRCGKLFISTKSFGTFFKDKTILNYKRNELFLHPPFGETIPKYLIQGQETFVVQMDRKLLTSDGTYKLTFYTSDGSCSKIFKHNLGGLFINTLKSSE